MKKINQTFLLGILAVSFISCDKETILTTSETPEEINEYVATHFPNNKIIRVVKDVNGLNKTYDITLDSNISLEFNRKKEIIEIDGSSKLPDSVIPSKIREYVYTNYPDSYITDWELEGKNQQIGLNNDLDIEFSMNGDFIRVDK
ncbi:MAG: PepSY-like domain-containing protein [Bacteroidetes bacterium]|nr:PepSY-like domain-containing protein [Bacteroidota bacterium]